MTIRYGSLALLALLPSVALAQAQIDEAACQDLQSTMITPDMIGEPVSAVVIDSASWQDAPAHCRIDGRLEPVVKRL